MLHCGMFVWCIMDQNTNNAACHPLTNPLDVRSEPIYKLFSDRRRVHPDFLMTFYCVDNFETWMSGNIFKIKLCPFEQIGKYGSLESQGRKDNMSDPFLYSAIEAIKSDRCRTINVTLKGKETQHSFAGLLNTLRGWILKPVHQASHPWLPTSALQGASHRVSNQHNGAPRVPMSTDPVEAVTRKGHQVTMGLLSQDPKWLTTHMCWHAKQCRKCICRMHNLLFNHYATHWGWVKHLTSSIIFMI